jgi:tRNA dimethylallyltransferase
VALLGATATGKTAAAIAVRRRLPVEVIAADSRQARREMRIGTAAPTDDELAAVPHHLVGIVDPAAPFTVADWLAAARAALDDAWARGALPLLVAGTGQYAWALLEGWRVPRVPPDADRRARLERLAGAEGGPALHARLAAVDPASAARIDPANVRRVVRALEIVEATGAPVPPLEHVAPEFAWRAVGLRWPREALYARADARVERMYAGGLIEETRALVAAHGREFEALRSIGYTEALQALDGSLTEAEAIARTKTATHRLIRMQDTWFRADDERIAWVDGADEDAVVAAVVRADEEMRAGGA